MLSSLIQAIFANLLVIHFFSPKTDLGLGLQGSREDLEELNLVLREVLLCLAQVEVKEIRLDLAMLQLLVVNL